MTIASPDRSSSPRPRSELDQQAIRLAGQLLMTGVWVERAVARRLRHFGTRT